MAAGDKANKSMMGWALCAEDEFGVVGPGPAHRMRIRPGAGLKNEPEDKPWEEAQPDRMPRGTSRVGNKAAGEISANVHLDDPCLPILLRCAMMNPVHAPAAITATTISVSESDNSFNGPGGTFASVKVGQIIKTSGFTAPANNGEFRVAEGSTGAKLIIAYGVLEDEAAGTSRTITPSKMYRNGVLPQSVSLEKFAADIAGRRWLFTGQCINSFGMEVNAQDYLNFKFGFMGKNGTKHATPQLPGSYTAPLNTKPLNASNHITGFRANEELFVPWSKIGFQFDNKLAAQIIGGQVFPDGYSLGKIDLKVNMEAFFVEDDPNYDLAFDGGESSMAWRMYDPLIGKGGWVTLPLFDYTGDPTPVDGDDGASMMTTTGSAKYDPLTECMIQFDLF